MAPAYLPYGRQSIDDDDVRAVAEALRGDYLTTGPLVAAFEKDFSAKTGAPHAVACSNGTAGLHLAAMAMGLGPGDAAIVPTMTFLATANCVRYVGADVVFADVDPSTGLITPETAAAALARASGRRVKALFVVHLNGQCADMPALAAFAKENGLLLVEDACHALGGEVAGTPVGSCAFGNFAVFSLHPVKTATMGEGGVVTTADPDLDRLMRRYRSHGMERDPAFFTSRPDGFDADGSANPWYYEMEAPGYNYRATDFQCALGRSQLSKLDRFVARRAELVARYRTRLEGLAPLAAPLGLLPGSRPGWHLCPALIDFKAAGKSRGKVMRELSALGIGSQVHYFPVHRQPYYRRIDPVLRLPGAEAYYERVLSLPLFYGMADEDVDRVVGALASVLGAQ
ncbi:MAG: UDP-4-amino-4,6-dideoxy-N-acetyl-beta-L-altrosamine transaminase [Rhodospirillales bacterium]|nr:UDP-4-amino-4,6-dideoxy-N-acetyl-beta-L-altrosamine transaminase [Rhodospirillales bacterium]